MKFRSDVDDRRAVAVIAVVLYHFSVPHVADGFRGIDVFFVVSGFLMTGIVFRGIEKGGFYVLTFLRSTSTVHERSFRRSHRAHSTVTDFARFLGLSTSVPLAQAV